MSQALPARAAGKPLEVWFQDEARVGQQGTLTRVWARRQAAGAPGSPLRLGLPVRRDLPRACHRAALVLPYANATAMRLHLEEISHRVAPGAHPILVLDGAGWHGAADLLVPDNLTLLPLPPRSPELNPVENVWQYLRQNHLSLRVRLTTTPSSRPAAGRGTR